MPARAGAWKASSRSPRTNLVRESTTKRPGYLRAFSCLPCGGVFEEEGTHACNGLGLEFATAPLLDVGGAWEESGDSFAVAVGWKSSWPARMSVGVVQVRIQSRVTEKTKSLFRKNAVAVSRCTRAYSCGSRAAMVERKAASVSMRAAQYPALGFCWKRSFSCAAAITAFIPCSVA